MDLTSKESKKVFSGLIELASFDQNNNSLYSVDPLFEKITIVKGDRVIGTIKINDLFTKNSMPPPKGHKRFFKGQSIYSPTEFRYIASEEAYFQSESYTKEILVINIDTEKIVTIPSKGKEFGYYILGIDKKGRIYTATSLNLDRILIHDKHGNYLLEIKPEGAKYGRPVNSIYDEILIHPVYIADDGHIFIMFQTEGGTFIVKYTLST